MPATDDSLKISLLLGVTHRNRDSGKSRLAEGFYNKVSIVSEVNWLNIRAPVLPAGKVTSSSHTDSGGRP